jgi:hypothetical protein
VPPKIGDGLYAAAMTIQSAFSVNRVRRRLNGALAGLTIFVAPVHGSLGSYHAFSTGIAEEARGSPGAGRGRATVGPVASMVRAAGHIAERRDHSS